MRETDPRSIAGKLTPPDRRVPLVVVGAGAAGVAAAIEAARAGVEVVLIDEHPVDNDMMAMDVPLCFGQRMDGSVRNRALMLERVVETNPDLAAAHEAGVDVQLGTYVWGAFVNGPTVQELPCSMLGLADDRRSWLLGYDCLIVAAGARDVLLGFPGWERAGTLGAGGAAALLARYRALAARRVVVLGSGALGLHTASVALERGIEVAGIVEVDARVRGDAARAKTLTDRGVPVFLSHTLQSARGRTGEIESVVLVAVNRDGTPIAGSEREIACDAVCWAIGLVPNVELLHLVGARLRFVSQLGGWVPEVTARMRTSVPTVFAAGDCTGFHEGMLAAPDVARAEGRSAGRAAAESLGAARGREDETRRRVSAPPTADETHRYWRAWLDSLIAAGGWEVNVCQCEEVTRRELVETKPPRYLGWQSPQMSAQRHDAPARRAAEPGSDQAAHARGDGAVPEPALPRAGRAPARARGEHHARSHPAADVPAADPAAAAQCLVARRRASGDARGVGELVRHSHAVQPALDRRHGDRRAHGARATDCERVRPR